MTEKTLVSIIVPIYNVEKYLRECVDSIIGQTYTNLEIILVDDGSPDRCPEICDEYAKQDNRIKVIHKPNGGLSDARNAGIEIAKGEYLSFVDSDDVIHCQMIEVLMKPILEDDNIKISACGNVKFQDGETITISKIDVINLHSETFDYRTMCLKCTNTAWGKIYSKNLFDDIKYPVGRLHEDEFTTYKICYNAKTIAYLECLLYFYRQRQGSIMSIMNTKRITDIHDALKEKIDFFFMQKTEKYMYSVALLEFVSWYNILKINKVKSIILDKWRTELQKYPIRQLSFKQKCNYMSWHLFPRIRNFIREYRSK